MQNSTGGVRIRLRALVLGLSFAVCLCAITPYNNIYRQATPLGGGHFPLAPFYILLWLTILCAIGSRFFKTRWLIGKELLYIWILAVLASGVAYTGLARTFFINLTAPFHFGSVENRWPQVLYPLMPESWYPQSQEAIERLYNGLTGGRQMNWLDIIRNIPWDTWWVPLSVWGTFVLLCYFIMLCMVKLLSRQALDHERMNFPLLRVPQMMEDAYDRGQLGRFLLNKYMVAGLAVPVCLHLLNGLSFYYPAVPQIPTVILAGPYFPKHGLFSGFIKLKIYFYPAFIGFAFLTTKQISLSFWAFHLLGALLIGFLGVIGYNIPAAALGVTFGPTLSRPEETQMIGAYGIFFLFLFWLARYHLWGIVQRGFGFRRSEQAPSEWMPSEIAFWGCIIGILILTTWLSYFGIPWWVSLLTVGAFFMVMLVATRVICQGGIAYFTLTAAPIDGLLTFFGPRIFTQAGILVAAVAQKVLFVDLRESLMPSLLHARKVTADVASRTLVLSGILLTLVCSVAVSFLAMLALCYKFGIRELQLDWATRTTVAVYDNIFTLVESPVHPGHWVMIFCAVGAVVMLVLVICYHRFYWWPIHPIGYLTAYSSAMRILWFSFFVGWLCNALCMRYGGVTLFKKLRLFFIGLIIGDFLMGASWALVGLFSYASYQVLPN